MSLKIHREIYLTLQKIKTTKNSLTIAPYNHFFLTKLFLINSTISEELSSPFSFSLNINNLY